MPERSSDKWDPQQYDKFRRERLEPVFDLIQLMRRTPGMRILDLGCGTGEITAMLVEMLPDSRGHGIDSSDEMLASALPRGHASLSFEKGSIESFSSWADYDLIFSNAAFHWVPDNEALMRRITAQMKPGAQLAVQLPNNERHASHTVARALVSSEPFAARLAGAERKSEALALERYAELMFEGGLRDMVCFEKVYAHVLARSTDVAEWTRGTLLVPWLSRLDAGGKEAFLAAYRRGLQETLGDRAPYFFAFRRMLLWGVKA